MDLGAEALEFLKAMDKGSRKVYTYGLSAFLRFLRETGYCNSLGEFLDMVEADLKLPRHERKRVARNIFNEFIRFCEAKYAPKTVRAYVAAVQSFAGYYDIMLSGRYVNLPSSNPVSQKFPWTLEKVVEFIGEIRNPEVQTISIIMFQSGLSLSDVLALTYGDIKYEFENGMVPMCLDLARIKTDVPFMTFIGNWGYSALKNHLAGKSLSIDDIIFPGGPSKERLVEHHFQKVARKWLGEYKGRNPLRPHSLRAAFRTILGDAGMDRDVVEFFMGHKLPEQLRVYHSRSRDGWRAIYAKYMRYLEPAGVKYA